MQKIATHFGRRRGCDGSAGRWTPPKAPLAFAALVVFLGANGYYIRIASAVITPSRDETTVGLQGIRRNAEVISHINGIDHHVLVVDGREALFGQALVVPRESAVLGCGDERVDQKVPSVETPVIEYDTDLPILVHRDPGEYLVNFQCDGIVVDSDGRRPCRTPIRRATEKCVPEAVLVRQTGGAAWGRKGIGLVRVAAVVPGDVDVSPRRLARRKIDRQALQVQEGPEQALNKTTVPDRRDIRHRSSDGDERSPRPKGLWR